MEFHLAATMGQCATGECQTMRVSWLRVEFGFRGATTTATTTAGATQHEELPGSRIGALLR
jgi:hypothetical protein